MTDLIKVRKTVVMIEDVRHDGGPAIDPPLRKGAIAAIVANPFAGRFVDDLSPWMDALGPLGDDLVDRLLAALGISAEAVEAFGKGVVVGADGNLEEGAAWHAPGGAALKRKLGVKGFVSSGQIMGGLGERLHIPVVAVHSPWVRSHFDGVDLSIADAPRRDEIVFALAMSGGARVHSRLGGLTFAEAERGDGPKF